MFLLFLKGMQLISVGFYEADSLYPVFAFHVFSVTLIIVVLNSKFCLSLKQSKSPFEQATISLYLSLLLFSLLVTTVFMLHFMSQS